MAELIERISGMLKDFFAGIETPKKIAAVFLAGVILVSFIGFIYWAGKSDYKILYTELNREDAKKIATLLEEHKISYQISNDGKTIKIPRDKVNKWRMQIATLGVDITGTVGYEVFDRQSFGTTNFVQKVNKQRALEGEMVKTINYIQGIKRSRVHLNIPESGPFVADKRPPSASVVLELERGAGLSHEEIKGVAQLISMAVEGMRPNNVVILNDRGKKLSENIGDDMTSHTANRVALEERINRQYEKRAEDILSKVVGKGSVIAKVAVKLDFTESLSTETTYDQENRALVSEVINTQKLEGARPAPRGVAGARSNLPANAQGEVLEARNNVDKQLATKNYHVPSKVTQSKHPTAKIQHVSVAVMLDGKKVAALGTNGAPLKDKNGQAIMEYAPWSKADLDNFSALIVSALGIDEKRGDKIVIKNMEFLREDLTGSDLAMQQAQRKALFHSLIKYLTIGLTILLFFFLVVRPFIQWLTDNTVESVEDFLPKTLEELERVQSKQKLPGLEDVLPEIEEKLNPEKIEGNMLREKIISLVESNPSKAAQVLHDMIHSTDIERAIA